VAGSRVFYLVRVVRPTSARWPIRVGGPATPPASHRPGGSSARG